MNRKQLANEIWRACDIMRRDDNCAGVMEYLEHLSWVLFLKFLDAQEQVLQAAAKRAGEGYRRVIKAEFQWSNWVPQALGRHSGHTVSPPWDGTRLMTFVRETLIPHLASLTGSPEREIVAGVFGGRNIIVCASPTNLKEVLSIIDGIDFKSRDDIYTVSSIYEELLRKLGSENRLAGEFYTPRPLVRFMVEVLDPSAGETVYDPACGSGGFLVEAFEHMLARAQSQREREAVRRRTFVGHEKKRLPALLGLMNMLLHGVLVPAIRRCNTLEEHASRKIETFDVILTNPPFGGVENEDVTRGFRSKSRSTELLFLEHILSRLSERTHARCGVVVPEGVLFRGGGFASLRKEMLDTFNLSMIVSLPPGVFAPYSDVKTAVLFFERSGPTREVLYYEMPTPHGSEKYGKQTLITASDFTEVQQFWRKWVAYRKRCGPRPSPTGNCWIEPVESIYARGCDFSPRNPSRHNETTPPHPSVLMDTLVARGQELQKLIERLHRLVSVPEDME